MLWTLNRRLQGSDPEMSRNAPPPSAFIWWFFAPKPSGRHRFTQPRESSSSVSLVRARSQAFSALQAESRHPVRVFGTLSALHITRDGQERLSRSPTL